MRKPDGASQSGWYLRRMPFLRGRTIHPPDHSSGRFYPHGLTRTWTNQFGLSGSLVSSPLRYAPELAVRKGHVTGIWTAILGASGAIPSGMPAGIWTITRYDFLGRESRIIASDHLGGVTTTDNEYNHRGSILHTYVSHVAGAGVSNATFTEEYAFTYDHEERLLTQTHSLNSGTPVKLAANSYDAIGRLSATGRANKDALTQSYAYNIRSWITAIYGALFSERLRYNDAPTGATPQWGGNISVIDWTDASSTAPSAGWSLTYDGLSRLTAAGGRSGGAIFAGNSSSYTYDSMGNLLQMSITSGQDTDSRQFTLAANSHRVSGSFFESSVGLNLFGLWRKTK